MDDLISRQAAITAIQNAYCDTEGGEDKYAVRKNVGLTAALHIMQDLQAAQRWIPVTERLPEPVTERTLEDEYVLISKKPTKLSGSKWSVAIAIRTADPRSGKIQWRDSGFGVIQDDKVLAWMPLPEPFRGGEQDEGSQNEVS